MSASPADSPAADLQPPRLVQSRRAIGRADRARCRAHRRGAAARRRRRPDRGAADRAHASLHPVRDPRGPARRPDVAAISDGRRRSVARGGARDDPGADLGGRHQPSSARAARLRRGVRHRRLQRRSTRAGAFARHARSNCPRPTRGSSLRAPSPLPADPRLAACWSAGLAPRPPSALRPRSRSWQRSRWPASTNPRANLCRAGIRCRTSGKAPCSSCATRCCVPSSSRSSSSTQRRSCNWPCSCLMPCAISACPQPASARRWRCTASAWWSARCLPPA